MYNQCRCLETRNQ